MKFEKGQTVYVVEKATDIEWVGVFDYQEADTCYIRFEHGPWAFNKIGRLARIVDRQVTSQSTKIPDKKILQHRSALELISDV